MVAPRISAARRTREGNSSKLIIYNIQPLLSFISTNYCRYLVGVDTHIATPKLLMNHRFGIDQWHHLVALILFLFEFVFRSVRTMRHIPAHAVSSCWRTTCNEGRLTGSLAYDSTLSRLRRELLLQRDHNTSLIPGKQVRKQSSAKFFFPH